MGGFADETEADGGAADMPRPAAAAGLFDGLKGGGRSGGSVVADEVVGDETEADVAVILDSSGVGSAEDGGMAEMVSTEERVE